MKAVQANALEFLKEPKQFLIPIYQRTYSWRLDQCERLWKDILKAGVDESIPGHFIGSVVYIESGLYQISELRQLLVIDGQQRLTTLALLFSALAAAVDLGKAPDLELSSKKIRNYYLFNSEEEGDLYYKLVLTQSDKTTLKALLDGTDLPDNHSVRLVENYEFFQKQIAQPNTSIASLYKGLSKLLLVDIVLTRGQDNPQLIFESLNSTGLELSQADLIRNYVLMGLEPNQQDLLYERYWYPMEKRFGLPESAQVFDRFMRDYLSLRTGRIAKTDDVYETFKAYSPDRSFEAVQRTVMDVHAHSQYFTNMALEYEPNDELRRCFADINTLKVDVVYPLLMHLYHHYSQKKLVATQFLQMLRVLESYSFRRTICGLPANSLHRFFVALIKETDPANGFESFAPRLILKELQQRFPNDDEFRNELVVRDVYNFRLRNYLLSKLENYGRKEQVDVDSYTIEHIMPQTDNLSEDWKRSLGTDWQKIHSTHLHTLGNLTLTGYNSELSDRPFVEKRDLEGGFADSPIRLNRGLAKLPDWNLAELQGRAQQLADQAVEIWDYPRIDETVLAKYRAQETEKGRQKYTLENHPHLLHDMNPLFEELRKRILNIDSSVKEEILKLYVAYKSTTNFVDVIGQKKRLLLSLNMPYNCVRDPQKLCKDMTGRGKWGNGDVQIELSAHSQLDAAMTIIRQAFDYQLEGNDSLAESDALTAAE